MNKVSNVLLMDHGSMVGCGWARKNLTWSGSPRWSKACLIWGWNTKAHSCSTKLAGWRQAVENITEPGYERLRLRQLNWSCDARRKQRILQVSIKGTCNRERHDKGHVIIRVGPALNERLGHCLSLHSMNENMARKK